MRKILLPPMQITSEDRGITKGVVVGSIAITNQGRIVLHVAIISAVEEEVRIFDTVDVQ